MISASLAAVVVLAAVDVWTGPELSFSIFYLLPVAVAAWWVGPRAGVSVAALSGLVWMLADRLSGASYSHPAIPYWNALVRFGCFGITSLLLARLKHALERERHLAATDPLTQVANSRTFYASAQTELARLRRYGHPLTVGYVDLDNFKQVNDRFGHEAGDEVLIRVAQTIRQTLRGGDEFAVLLPETDEVAAPRAFRHLSERLAAEMQAGEWPVTFSIGVVTIRSALESVDELVHLADQLMYEVKGNTKDAIRYDVHRAAQPVGRAGVSQAQPPPA